MWVCRVAIKVISKLNFSSEKDTANMKLETALMMRVRGHPNVVRARAQLLRDGHTRYMCRLWVWMRA